MTTVLVTGASGFVGSKLAAALIDAGHEVRAMTRHPESYRGAGTPIYGDVASPESLRTALEGVETAYYLVHALADNDFRDKDAAAARAFSSAAAQAELAQIIYLGGLGADTEDLSEHLKSRREVEHLLASDRVPVTVLRAAIIVGDGGISWEITRQLVDRLPVMVTPRWVTTRTQPIALPDVISYLVGVLQTEETRGKTYEIGGPEVLTYAEMMRRVAQIRHGRSLPIVVVPMLTPRLSSRWLSLITDVDVATGRNLVDSMTTEVIVTDDSITSVVPLQPRTYDDAVRLAFADLDRRRATP